MNLDQARDLMRHIATEYANETGCNNPFEQHVRDTMITAQEQIRLYQSMPLEHQMQCALEQNEMWHTYQDWCQILAQYNP